MAIPEISGNDVLTAIELIRKEGVPPTRQSTRYLIVHDGRQYPPKYVVSLAVENATGHALRAHEFSGGAETNSLLRRLGFSVVAFSRDAAGARQPSAVPRGKTRLARGAEQVIVSSKAADQTALIGRIVVRGQTGSPATGEAMLLDVLRNQWPDGVQLKFLLTPGGFVVAPFPTGWSGGIGWNSKPTDLAALQVHAARALRRTVTDRVLKAAEGEDRYPDDRD